ncbi:Aste57867_8712 [Aphanomyces stellatus]|uniref:Aste57867_8712 protein n=1 Tax=Aphanomyces stellatus TaxID=120398 RepID=A0A485KL14_9STRA|nr:hypothetical protein As57867_008678 [Aphanomyces stellatus]VFT85598.1 Aste57867_8712 [Aphanomyces stellatus]
MWTVIGVGDVAPAPWKNGGGQTRQLVAWPVGASEWTLRVSIADVTQDGPFSSFDDIRRWFGILIGDGVRLFDSMDIRVGDPLYEFDGGLAPPCSLLGGSVRDFNIMLREGPSTPPLQVLDAQASPEVTLQASTKWAGLFTVDGGALTIDGHCNASTSKTLPPTSLVWSDSFTNGPATLRAKLSGPGAAFWMILSA